MANFASEASDQVLNFLKATGLDFKIVETPFSLEIQIKKKFIKYNQSHPGSQLRVSSSRLQPEIIPDSSSNLKQFSNSSSKLPPSVSAHSSCSSSTMDIKAKDIPSSTLPLPLSTSQYGTLVTDSNFKIPATAVMNTFTSITPPQANTFNVSMPGQAVFPKSVQNIDACDKFPPILSPRLRPTTNLRTPSSPATSSPPRTPPPTRTTPTRRTPPPGFPEHIDNDIEEECVSKEEFKQILAEHFRRINLDTAAAFKEAFKPLEANFDEADRKLDNLAKSYSQAPCLFK